jgi:hypothetical protein
MQSWQRNCRISKVKSGAAGPTHSSTNIGTCKPDVGGMLGEHTECSYCIQNWVLQGISCSWTVSWARWMAFACVMHSYCFFGLDPLNDIWCRVQVMKLLIVLFLPPSSQYSPQRCSRHPRSTCIHDLRSSLGEASYCGLLGYDTVKFGGFLSMFQRRFCRIIGAHLPDYMLL